MKALLFCVALLTACYSETRPAQVTAANAVHKTDLEIQKDVFFRCMESIPSGASHTSVGSSDWNKVITECHKVSYDLAQVSDEKPVKREEKPEEPAPTVQDSTN